MRRWRWWILAALIVASCAIAACYEWAAPTPLPAPEYATWWTELIGCAGNKNGLALEGIAWEIRAEPVPQGTGRIRVGEWSPPNHIWIAEGWLADPGVVKHEMLHYLLQRRGHPVPPFVLCTEGLRGFLVEDL